MGCAHRKKIVLPAAHPQLVISPNAESKFPLPFYAMYLFLLFFICIASSSVQAYPLIPLKHRLDITHTFLQPSDVAVGFDHRIYVLDGVNNCVKVFNQDGLFRQSFGAKGDGPGQFNAPLGIAADSTGKIYIADSGNHRVQVFTPDGAFVSRLALNPAKGDLLCDPVDVAIDESRQQLYVVDNDNHHVYVYSLGDSKLIATWGSEGELREQFKYPFFIAVGTDTSVFIVDVINTRVQVYSPKGEVMSTIGSWGVDVGQFYRPKGVCVDRDNRIFVSDSYLGVIQVFNRYGHLKGVLGDENGAVMKWKTPVGITIDDMQRLYVVDMIENRVSVYDILETVINKQ